MANNIVKVRPPEDTSKELLDLIGRCYQEKPDKADLRELRKYLKENPFLHRAIFDLGKAAQDNLMEKMVSGEAAHIAMGAQIELIRQDMGYADSPMLEKLMIDNIAMCWLRYNWVELQLAGFMGMAEVRFSEIQHWDKRLSTAQQRYLRACETLARVRKITRKTPALQINLAEQQINVAGDLVKESAPDLDV